MAEKYDNRMGRKDEQEQRQKEDEEEEEAKQEEIRARQDKARQEKTRQDETRRKNNNTGRSMTDWNESDRDSTRGWAEEVTVVSDLLLGWADGPEMVNRIVGFDAAKRLVLRSPDLLVPGASAPDLLTRLPDPAGESEAESI